MREHRICTIGNTTRSSMAKCGSSKRALLHSAPQSDSQLFSLRRKGGGEGSVRRG